MPAYVLVQLNVSDPEKYEAYKNLTPATIEQYGGKFLVRGGRQEDVEGTLAYARLVLLEFDSMDQARRWYTSPEYQHAKSLREGAAEAVFTIVDGVGEPIS